MSNYKKELKELKELKTKLEDLEEKINSETVKIIIAEQKLEWGETCSKKLNWEEAKEWCKMKGDGWRLPTVLELLTAYYYKVDGFTSGYHWSSTEYSEPNACLVGFSVGDVATGVKTYRYTVRRVRNY